MLSLITFAFSIIHLRHCWTSVWLQFTFYSKVSCNHSINHSGIIFFSPYYSAVMIHLILINYLIVVKCTEFFYFAHFINLLRIPLLLQQFCQNYCKSKIDYQLNHFFFKISSSLVISALKLPLSLSLPLCLFPSLYQNDWNNNRSVPAVAHRILFFAFFLFIRHGFNQWLCFLWQRKMTFFSPRVFLISKSKEELIISRHLSIFSIFFSLYLKCGKVQQHCNR